MNNIVDLQHWKLNHGKTPTEKEKRALDGNNGKGIEGISPEELSRKTRLNISQVLAGNLSGEFFGPENYSETVDILNKMRQGPTTADDYSTSEQNLKEAA